MSAPIIVQVVKGVANQTYMQLLQAPEFRSGQEDDAITVFDCDMTGMTAFEDADTVKRHGQKLLKSLRASHKLVDSVLQRAFELGEGSCRPIYLELKALPPAESYCWEALCTDAGDFLTLDRRWPVARVVESYQGHGETRQYIEPLKIMVVLGAAGVDPIPEWESIYSAVKDARDKGLAIQLHVGTSNETLMDQIRDARNTDCELFQFALTSMVQLIGVADDLEPHLVHFLCHGSTSMRKPRLEITIMSDGGDASIEVTMTDLLASPGVKKCWLAVLNCCNSGEAASDMPSLSASLVAGGLHAAIGMKEKVSVPNATAFSKGLYPALLRNLRTTLTKLEPNTDAVIEWSSCLWEPRRGLRDRPGEEAMALVWTLPVIHVQRAPFRVRRGLNDVAAARAAARERTIAEFLALLPQKKRALIEQELALL